MSSIKLKDRINSYQELSDYKLLPRVPLIIYINGRSFSKATELLDKPHCNKLSECLLSTTLRLCNEVDGAIFAYQFNDEIILIVRNDQNTDTAPWHDNKLQSICSATSSIATLHFNNCAKAIELNLVGEPIFRSHVFVVPNILEAINTLIYKQQQNFYSSMQFACFYELLKKYDKHHIKEMLNGLSVDEKNDILYQECEIDFNSYHSSFRRGSACYKVPKIIKDGTMKNKWFINSDLPIFTQNQSFLSNIAKNGSDIFRSTGL